MKNKFFLLNKRGSAPNSNAKGVYELKQEYQDFYSPYFYHYTRTEKTKVCFEFYSKIKIILKRNHLFFYSKKSEEYQLSLKKSDKEKFFKPPKLPPLSDLYTNMRHLLDSDVFVRIVFCTLRRIASKSKYASEGQLVRVKMKIFVFNLTDY